MLFNIVRDCLQFKWGSAKNDFDFSAHWLPRFLVDFSLFHTHDDDPASSSRFFHPLSEKMIEFHINSSLSSVECCNNGRKMSSVSFQNTNLCIVHSMRWLFMVIPILDLLAMNQYMLAFYRNNGIKSLIHPIFLSLTLHSLLFFDCPDWIEYPKRSPKFRLAIHNRLTKRDNSEQKADLGMRLRCVRIYVCVCLFLPDWPRVGNWLPYNI